jgi:hypothetical protein
MKLIQRLDRKKSKLDKESGSNKSGSHRSPDEKRRAISVIRHHHHSSRHSNNREDNNSIPFIARKNKKSGVDEL